MIVKDAAPTSARIRPGSKKRKRKFPQFFLERTGRRNDEGALSPAEKRPFCVFDLESKDEDTDNAGFTRPFVAGLYDPAAKVYREAWNEPHLAKRPWRRRHLEPGGCIDKLMNWLLVPEYSGYAFYAHFGGSFDHLFLLAWLILHDDEFGFEVIPVQSSIQVLRVWRWPVEPGEEAVEIWDFLDTHKLLPMALSKACKAFRVPNKLDHDLNRPETMRAEWSAYLRRDCEALSQVMTSLVDMVHDRLGGEVGITTPSTSMKLFRRKYIGEHGVPLKIPRYAHWSECRKSHMPFDAPGACPGCAHMWIRMGYYGGRTEIFRMFGVGLHYFDINSSYVAAMKEDMPIGDWEIQTPDAPGNRIWWDRHRRDDNPNGGWTGFAEVTVWIPESCPIPPLPHKDRTTGKLQFPVGQFHGVWCLDELKLLDDPLVQGRILHTVKVVYYRLKPCFGAMVSELWKLRDTGRSDYDPGLSELAKLLGNGLYGKFAMRQERTTMAFVDPDAPPGSCFLCGAEAGEHRLCLGCEGSKPASENDPDCRVWYQAKKVDAPYIIPQISAYITAKARVRLWQFMRTAMRTPGALRPAADFTEGDVAVVNGRPCMVLRNETLDIRTELVLRDLDAEVESLGVGDTGWTGTPDMPLTSGGRVFYSDTDSVIVDVLLPPTMCLCGHARVEHDVDPLRGQGGRCKVKNCKCRALQVHTWGTGSKLGEMKDEHPGEQLNYLAVQPKVYVIERTKHNTQWTEGQRLRAALLSGALSAAEAEAVRTRIGQAEQEVALYKAQQDAPYGTYAKHEFYPASKLDPIAGEYHAKVTMKGFPPKLRTKANLERLRGGPIDWNAIRKGTAVTTGAGETLAWPQLEKVRTLARRGFADPPRMRERCRICIWTKDGKTLVSPCPMCRDGKGPVAVSKSFQSPYDKRILYPDETGRTRAVVLNEPIGGYREDDFAQAAE